MLTRLGPFEAEQALAPSGRILKFCNSKDPWVPCFLSRNPLAACASVGWSNNHRFLRLHRAIWSEVWGCWAALPSETTAKHHPNKKTSLHRPRRKHDLRPRPVNLEPLDLQHQDLRELKEPQKSSQSWGDPSSFCVASFFWLQRSQNQASLRLSFSSWSSRLSKRLHKRVEEGLYVVLSLGGVFHSFSAAWWKATPPLSARVFLFWGMGSWQKISLISLFWSLSKYLWTCETSCIPSKEKVEISKEK